MGAYLNLYASTRRQAAATVYSDWAEVIDFVELLLALVVTAQGTYTNETLDVTIQSLMPDGSIIDLASFTQVGNATAGLPYKEALKLTIFGGKVRAKIVTAGTAVDYTLNITGYGK